ncbi:MAG: phosphoribosyltransferase [Opitutales bacterium]
MKSPFASPHMEREIPSNFEQLHDAEALQGHVECLARPIEQWAAGILAETGRPVLALCILRGAVHFFSDLVKACRVSIEPAFCRTWSYSSEENAQLGTIRTDFLGSDFTGRDVLLVDDICDTGHTLRHLVESLTGEHGARSVKSTTLIYRERPDSVFRPDWHALAYSGGEWLVGYGMEDRNRYMNYPALYRLV